VAAVAEAKTRRRIRKAVEARGFGIESIEWEPVYDGGEMSGWSGGWTVITDRPYRQSYFELYGLSVEEVLADIDWSLQPAEPCGCYPEDRPDRHPLNTIKGDPSRPLHEPDCRWFIAYRLRWWKDAS